MGAGASTYDGASNSGNSLSDMAAGDVAAFVADQGEDFEAYKQPLIEQGLDGKALTNISAEELEAAMESAKIEEAHREILRERTHATRTRVYVRAHTPQPLFFHSKVYLRQRDQDEIPDELLRNLDIARPRHQPHNCTLLHEKPTDTHLCT